MTLHPWPLNDQLDGDHAAVLWAGPRGRGLLSDSLAVPLRFMPAAAGPATAPMPAAVAAPKATFDSSALLRLHPIACRFGTGG